MKHDTERLLKVCLSVTFANKKPDIDSSALHKLTYGVFVLTAKDQKDNGCITNTAIQVANDPMRISVSVQKGNYTREMIEKTKKFNVSVLTDDVPFEIIKHFGMQSGRDVDKFESFTATATASNGIKYITEHTNAYFSAEVVSSLDLGSHVLFIGEITEAKSLSKDNSCNYAHYHASIKPKF